MFPDGRIGFTLFDLIPPEPINDEGIDILFILQDSLINIKRCELGEAMDVCIKHLMRGRGSILLPRALQQFLQVSHRKPISEPSASATTLILSVQRTSPEATHACES